MYTHKFGQILIHNEIRFQAKLLFEEKKKKRNEKLENNITKCHKK